eukprot:CAMPEP_0119109032 /NCGR_PEP_ID=MMETSP1180-20130426/16883_1 /TAXON_ID=3052 ORGANISM="Chlamydomonas cf sp, Strain CCMP681" /NCGR_SAMPLE_ID=MMETSP1180 /ASSEMBLY_ACC=CAM_ASM_000741 /LENGTH=42 /DNA_ID= /DNA_START= /DNA_END= /DNA_ORIENTATION=
MTILFIAATKPNNHQESLQKLAGAARCEDVGRPKRAKSRRSE